MSPAERSMVRVRRRRVAIRVSSAKSASLGPRTSKPMTELSGAEPRSVSPKGMSRPHRSPSSRERTDFGAPSTAPPVSPLMVDHHPIPREQGVQHARMTVRAADAGWFSKRPL